MHRRTYVYSSRASGVARLAVRRTVDLGSRVDPTCARRPPLPTLYSCTHNRVCVCTTCPHAPMTVQNTGTERNLFEPAPFNVKGVSGYGF
jgi:hypothetical protein